MSTEKAALGKNGAALADDEVSAEQLAKREERRLAKQKAKEEKAAKLAAKKQRQAEEQAARKAKASEDGDGEAKKKRKKKELRLRREYVNTVPSGEKKDMLEPMAKAYDPPAVESAWYDWWEAQGFFKPAKEAPKDAEKFVIVIPPPNVTGSLHLGHALTNSVQDTLVRWRRMRGDDVLWVPGTDHAGIATQSVVVKALKRKGIDYRDLGRERFVQEVWKWKEEKGAHITTQLRRLGSSLDWTREVFTMDDVRSNAVEEEFIRMFDDNMIYRADRLVNYSCALQTAISNEEVDYIDIEKPTKMKVPGHTGSYEFGKLIKFAYRLTGSDDSDDAKASELVVATTRLETMLGDTAVAVHPDDPRYTHFHGKTLQHPFVEREIPVILDADLVDMEFGTGCVKVTPAHDPNDFACGERHKLEQITIFATRGCMADNCGPFAGMMRFDARVAVLEKLKELGLYRGEEPNAMRLGMCSRSKDVIEPMLCPQWYVDCTHMAKMAADAVRNKELEIVPEFHEKVWFQYLDNIRPWCISRQLWWGHRIPVWHVSIEGAEALDPNATSSWVAARTEGEAKHKAAKRHAVSESEISVSQDEDVLDTWFSSALFPFSVFGWPQKTADLERFFPTSVLETGHDILFFWVARMVMVGLYLTKQLPFKRVLLHAMVRDAQSRKMSKSKGNVVDPIAVIEGITLQQLHNTLLNGNLPANEIEIATQGQKESFPKGISECGTDALRFALAHYTMQGRSINLDVNVIITYRNFCNKMWNATRFALMALGSDFVPAPTISEGHSGTMLVEERFMFSRLLACIDKVHAGQHTDFIPAATVAEGLSGTLLVEERFMFSRLLACIDKVHEGLHTFVLGEATDALTQFWVDELCDVFVEAMKPYLRDTSAHGLETKAHMQQTLYTLLECGLRLLHPFMPFVTEELWQRLPRRSADVAPSIMVASFPDSQIGVRRDEEAEEQVRLAFACVSIIRKLRGIYKAPPQKKAHVTINAHDELTQKRIAPLAQSVIASLALCKQVDVVLNKECKKTAVALAVEQCDCDVYVDLTDLVDLHQVLSATRKELQNVQKNKDKLEKKRAQASYAANVPQNIQELEKGRLTEFDAEMVLINTTISNLEDMVKM